MKLFFIFVIIAHGISVSANPKIYLVRHAEVDLNKPGWGTSKKSEEYKAVYNRTGVKEFNPNKILQKIENHKNIDTVFCSPQLRALKTAEILFGNRVVFKIDSVITELDYPVAQVPVLQLPVKGWLFLSRVTWMWEINRGNKTSYRERLDELNLFSNDLEEFAKRNDQAVVIAHGMVNRELIKILTERGWNYCKNGKDGLGNLSVNCLEYQN